ncbi:hypothetical protein ACMV_P4_00040 (plasmid) [Acidiphilium multivorum AIU301]|uniref:Uncharacterized protein n=1 Tax=Acidiphilium multivorum (strain DSM 11245 / JCM 8867 / NBRC 100883 / AIU 301) TaxID=926570 RepID=F0J7Z7_ACIMA|nr:hypothetical protein ACMV_P4_00040 [Acidiphilium multivorum AIU301]
MRYTDTIMSRCEALNLFPGRGIACDDIRVGLRINSFRKLHGDCLYRWCRPRGDPRNISWRAGL